MKTPAAIILIVAIVCSGCQAFDWFSRNDQPEVALVQPDPEPAMSTRSIVNSRLRRLERQNADFRETATDLKIRNAELEAKVKDLEAQVAYYEQYLADIRENRSGRKVLFDSPASGGTLHRLAPGSAVPGENE